MAIARGNGTEIIRSHAFSGLNSTYQNLIVGVPQHIYTVLSIVVHAVSMNTQGTPCWVYLEGYDARTGTTATMVTMFKQNMNNDQTFVWNDKFSFNGHEPVDFTAGMDSIAKQDAIADQGSSVAQYLRCYTSDAADNFEVGITYIDQNNS